MPGWVAAGLLDVIAGFALLALSVTCFAISTPFGIGCSFVLTLGLCIILPASMPLVIIISFLFQNMIVAAFTPLVPNDEVFDALRGANFVMLMTAYGAFILASFQTRLRAVPGVRPWLLASFGLLVLVSFYLVLGAINGEPKDAIVYFRNTISAVACFHIGLVAASLNRVNLIRPLLWIGALAICYGYFELIFNFSFLSLFNGDIYIERNMRNQIDTGAWERVLSETGFVFRGLEDLMMTSFFNTPLLADIFPKVFRIGGPNFHAIAYAYALSVISIFLLFGGRWILPLVALPLLVIIGSKGAMVLLVLAIAVKIGLQIMPARPVLILLVGASALWIASAIALGIRSGDYHVLGFFAGLRDFPANPIGRGLGLGGNLSSTSETIDWSAAQATGSTIVPMESAIGVMLYQMGVGALLFVGFLIALAEKCRRIFERTGDQSFLFGTVGIVVLTANAILQEEAFFSPLALAFCLILVGVLLGSHQRDELLAAS